MTVPRTVLVAALLLAIIVAAAPTLFSVGPYDYDTNLINPVYLLWYPPHAVPMNLTFLNVTWWKPEAIWFVGKYPVHICDGGCGYVPATIYVVQDGVRVVDPSKTPLGILVADFVGRYIKRICAQGTAMVAPNKIIELNPTTQIWISDIYCLYGNRWYWLRLLPYTLKDELIVEGVELVNASIYVKIPSDYPWPLIPAGWYLDPVTKRVFRIPSNDTAVMAELQRLRVRVSELEAELANKTAQLAQLNATAMQLNMTVAQLNASLAEARGEAARLAAENQRLRAKLEELNATRIKLEGEIEAYKSQLEALRSVNATLAAMLARLETENQALKAQLNTTLNKTLSDQASQLEAWTRTAWIGATAGAAAGAAVTALALGRRK